MFDKSERPTLNIEHRIMNKKTMRNPDCKKYDECLDLAAHGKIKMDCGACNEFDPETGDVHTQWPEADPDYFRFHQKKGEKTMTTKVCSNPNCKHKGEPQDISRFAKHPDSKDGYAGVCYDCKNQQNKDRKAAKKAGTYVSRRGKGGERRASSFAKAMEDRGKENRLQTIKDTAARRGAKKAAAPTQTAIVAEASSALPVMDMTVNNEIYRTVAAIFVRGVERKFLESIEAELKK